MAQVNTDTNGADFQRFSRNSQTRMDKPTETKLNYGDRSKFIRDAILEKLNREGIETRSSLAATPARFGKTRDPTEKRILRDVQVLTHNCA